ncbi:MAG: iron-sulfur cluster assembly scaffold protein [Actinobacteria bacterium]|nr:iron-sulfur cluster assembly scaffold protein [Actinomycetota bacterium]
MYSQQLLDRFLSPTFDGELPGCDGLGIEGNVTCGDVVHLAIRLEANRVAEAKFRARGCAIAIAAADVASELLQGETLTSAQVMSASDIQLIIGDIPQERSSCVEIVLGALRAAVEQARAGLTSETA